METRRVSEVELNFVLSSLTRRVFNLFAASLGKRGTTLDNQSPAYATGYDYEVEKSKLINPISLTGMFAQKVATNLATWRFGSSAMTRLQDGRLRPT